MRALATLALFLATGLIVTSASAHETRAGSLVIEHPWSRATTPAQKNGAAYMIIHNPGTSPDRLLAARSGEADNAGLHDSTVTAEGVARMRPADPIEIPAGGELRLAPGGVHVMLAGLKGPLYEGVSFPLTLVFERAGEVAVEVEVMAGSPPPGGHGDSSTGAGGTAEHGRHGAPPEGDHGAQHGN